MKNTKAFTLIEILTVITIIVILLSIGIPAYNSWRNRAQIAKAKATISQIEMALEMYKTENNGVYPNWGEELNNPSNPIIRQYLSAYMKFNSEDMGSGNPPVRDPNGNILLDPWGRYYVVLVNNDNDPANDPSNFLHNKNTCYIYSYGPNGKEIRDMNYGGDDADNVDNYMH